MSFLLMWIQLPALILGITELTDWAVRKLPTLKFESGQLEISGPQKSYLFVLEKDFPFLGKNFHIVIDAESEKKHSEIPMGLFLTKNQMVIKDAYASKVFAYPEDFSLTISSFTLIHWRDIFLWVMPVYLGVRTFLNLVLFRGLEVILLASLAFLGLRLMKKNVSWNACFSVAAVALTPALVFVFLITIFGPFLAYSGLIYYGIGLVYFSGALRACLTNETKKEGTDAV
jgi:hypothetical protein